MAYHDELKTAIHKYIRYVYEITELFPDHEKFGITSQIRRSSVSVMLNYIEGYARRTGTECKTYINFLRISYGSLKESKYLLFLANDINYISPELYKRGISLSDKIGKMLYPIIK